MKLMKRIYFFSTISLCIVGLASQLSAQMPANLVTPTRNVRGVVKAEDGAAANVEYRSMLDVPLIATSGKGVDFIDKRWVEHTYFLTRQYNKPEKLPEAVLHHENINYPLAASGTVLRNDDGSLGFYYQTTPRHRPWAGIAEDTPASLKKKWAKTGGLYRYYLHYATSTNGVNWEIPNLGLRQTYEVTRNAETITEEGPTTVLVKKLDDKNNNLVLAENEVGADGNVLTASAGVGGGFCVLDARQTPHPASRGRYTALFQRSGFRFAYSDDGLHWKVYPIEERNIYKNSSDTYNTFIYDQRRGLYYLFHRPNTSQVKPSCGDARAVARIESKDLIHWENSRIVLDMDELDGPAQGRTSPGSPETRGRGLQFYGFTVRPYQDIYIGLALVFDSYSLEMWQELVYSYDCLEWRRDPLRKPYITASPGTWNIALGYSACGCPIEIGGHHYFYYQGRNNKHSSFLSAAKEKGHLRHICAARVRKGRFIGYITGQQRAFERPDKKKKVVPREWVNRGQLLTRPFKLESDKIFVNAQVENEGSLVIEICNSNGIPIEGYREQEAIVIKGKDEIRIPVEFKGGGIGSLRGQKVRLRMHLEKAGVYGLAFE